MQSNLPPCLVHLCSCRFDAVFVPKSLLCQDYDWNRKGKAVGEGAKKYSVSQRNNFAKNEASH